MFTISNKSDYGLVLLSYLADKKEYVSLKHLVDATKLPPRFIARIAAELVHHNILISREGKVGGYRLAKPLSEVNLYEYVTIFEEDFALVKCEKDGYACQFEGVCVHNSFFRNTLSAILRHELKRWTLNDLLKRKDVIMSDITQSTVTKI